MERGTLVQLLVNSRNIIVAAGEVDFADLKKKDKQAIYAAFEEETKFEFDGDGDGSYAIVNLAELLSDDSLDGIQIIFESDAEYDYEIAKKLSDLRIDDVDSDDTVTALQNLIDMLSISPRFVNLTPHALNLYDAERTLVVLTVPAEDQMVRVSQQYVQVPAVGGHPVVRSTYGAVVGLPEPQYNTYYIVSLLVAQALADSGIHRTDILVPDTGAGAVRNESGGIIGTTRFMIV
ncbi:hypothetical protein KIH86_02920 [Paenibacillus sp. HN-1]|uniref:hypothetical protein n=1 Tax=Paenibacillus TaxID=44249 RepID=UPI001CA98E70|nr:MULTISPECIES: hypothetical protein [Paenibacillus]MBY9080972.1 hypothetical protein [Paenibacillus sp. CGMCC 1.18879]MBY9083184.1 hypothetical protein [Paenibacillus sinensis]